MPRWFGEVAAGLRPRRARRGTLEPLCDESYREAMDKVARELAEEAATDGRDRFRTMQLVKLAEPCRCLRKRVRLPEDGQVARQAGIRARQPLGRGVAPAEAAEGR